MTEVAEKSQGTRLFGGSKLRNSRRYLRRKGISPPEVTISDRERFRRSAVRIHHHVDPSSCRTGLTANHFYR